MITLYLDNNDEREIHKLCRYIYSLHPNVNDFELLGMQYLDESLFHFDYGIQLKGNPITFYFKNNKIQIQNIRYNQNEELGCDNIYHVNKHICIKAKNIEIIEELFKTSQEYSEQLLQRINTKEKIDILKFDYGWSCSYRTTKRSKDTLYLPEKDKNALFNDIDVFFKSDTKQRYKDLSLTHCRTYLFYGIPGTGKTSTIRAIASTYNLSIAIIDFDKEMDDKTLQRAIKKVPKSTIIIIEDIDCLFMNRKSHDDFKNSVTFSGLLNSLDGVVQNDEVLIFLTTNHEKSLDSALKRRIDFFMEFKAASKIQIESMFKKFYPTNKRFEEFYNYISKKNITINILQKFFSKHLFDDVVDYKEEINEYILSDEKNDLYL